jgi:pimeloyl-ACP methyl ester carboxylesterase
VQLFNFVMSEPPFIPTPILRALAQERIKNNDLEKHIFSQVITASIEDRITGLSVPSLIVWDDRDRALRVATAEILHRLLPRSRLIIRRVSGICR